MEQGKQDWFLVPPAPHKCQTCAREHGPLEPHDASSLYYQMKFKMEHERDATWIDAMAHCPPAIRELVTEALTEVGVNVLAGEILPKHNVQFNGEG